MPNRDEHCEAGSWTGIAVAGLANVVAQAERKRRDPNYQFNVGELTAAVIAGHFVGRFAGQLPDILEPAYHPGHRDLFHSVGFGALVVLGANGVNKNPRAPGHVKLVIKIAAAAYVSHLVMDGRTPAGIPLLTNGGSMYF